MAVALAVVEVEVESLPVAAHLAAEVDVVADEEVVLLTVYENGTGSQ